MPLPRCSTGLDIFARHQLHPPAAATITSTTPAIAIIITIAATPIAIAISTFVIRGLQDESGGLGRCAIRIHDSNGVRMLITGPVYCKEIEAIMETASGSHRPAINKQLGTRLKSFTTDTDHRLAVWAGGQGHLHLIQMGHTIAQMG